MILKFSSNVFTYLKYQLISKIRMISLNEGDEKPKLRIYISILLELSDF